jgi:hypothetical protein
MAARSGSVTGHAVRIRATGTADARHGYDVVTFTGRLLRNPAPSDHLQPGEPARACDFLAAGLPGAGQGWLEIADVIMCEGKARPARNAARLISVLGQYPGCAVAAASASAGSCMIAARCGTMVSITISGPPAEPGLRALVCGSFVHAWLCAGRPLAGLDPSSLRVAARRGAVGWKSLIQGGIWSCLLKDADGPAPDW